MYESNLPKLNEVILIPITLNDFQEMIRDIVRHEIQDMKLTSNRYDTKPLRLKEAMAYLGISRTTLYRLVRDGEIEPFKSGRILFFSKESLDRFLRGELPKVIQPGNFLNKSKRKN